MREYQELSMFSLIEQHFLLENLCENWKLIEFVLWLFDLFSSNVYFEYE